MVTLANIASAHALMLSLLIAASLIGFYFAMGLYAQQEKAWAFYLGLAIYAVDTALCLFLKDWFSAAFHAWPLWAIFRAIKRLKQLQET